jgi:hypothetical protein
MSDPMQQQPPTGSDLAGHTADLLAKVRTPVMACSRWQPNHCILRKAQAHRKRLHVDRHLPLRAPCKDIGSIYGAGVGLYFKSLQWYTCLLPLSHPLLGVSSLTVVLLTGCSSCSSGCSCAR